MTLTTRQAAELAGITPASFRREMHRERGRGRDYRAPAEVWPDARTPLWNRQAVEAWLAGRPLKPAENVGDAEKTVVALRGER